MKAGMTRRSGCNLGKPSFGFIGLKWADGATANPENTPRALPLLRWESDMYVEMVEGEVTVSP